MQHGVAAEGRAQAVDGGTRGAYAAASEQPEETAAAPAVQLGLDDVAREKLVDMICTVSLFRLLPRLLCVAAVLCLHSSCSHALHCARKLRSAACCIAFGIDHRDESKIQEPGRQSLAPSVMLRRGRLIGHLVFLQAFQRSLCYDHIIIITP